VKRLVLIGGGHSHLEVLRRLAAQPRHGLEVVLLTPDRHAIYSGMIPGVIAGDYAFEDCRIDLAALARRAGARLVLAAATGLDPGRRGVLSSSGESLEYDLASLDVGSRPATHGVPGVAEHAMNARPAAQLLQRLAAWTAPRGQGKPRRIAVVGAGAAGAEIAFTLWHRLNRDGAMGAQVTLVADAAGLLPGFDTGTRRLAVGIAAAREIPLRLGAAVIAVDAKGLTLAGGEHLEADLVIWVAGAAAPSWIAATPLATDAAGFVAINDCLQSLSHPEVFAAGDCAGNAADPRPKSGVFAVRQGPVLAANLLRASRGEPLLSFHSSSGALAILNCGGRRALASWRGHAFSGRWVWGWKDWLDRRFLRRYRGGRGQQEPGGKD